MKEQVSVDENKCLYCKMTFRAIELLNYHMKYRCLKADYARLKRLEENVKKLINDPELTVITKGLLKSLYDETEQKQK